MRSLSLVLLAPAFLTACEPQTELLAETRVDVDGDHYFSDEECNDEDASAHPGATEVCDGVDNDCNGEVDEDVTTAFFMDLDGDGYGDPKNVATSCGDPVAGAVSNSGDCDDTTVDISPLGTEVCDGVDNDCDGFPDWGLRVPADYELISDAVTRARDGETVCVSPGTYVDNIDFAGHEVLVVGLDGPETTIIDGGGTGPVVSFDTKEGAGAILRGFTITGGDEAMGAGIYIRNADPTLENLIIDGNVCYTSTTYCYGTGIYAEDSYFSLTDSRVSNNIQSSSYAYYPYNYGAGVFLSRSDAEFENVEISGNTVLPVNNSYYGAAYGVGVYVSASSPYASGLTVSGNYVDGSDAYGWYTYGVGMLFMYGGGYFDHLVVADNWGTGYVVGGGGMFLQSYYLPPEFTNAIIANNHVGDAASSYAYGGAFHAYYTTATFENVDFVGNSATGAYAVGGQGYFSYYSALHVNNSSFWGGEATSTNAGGGGALTYDTGYAPGVSTFTYCSFSNNGETPFVSVSTPVGVSGTIEGDPKYASVAAESALDWDLTLGSGSDLIDAGDPSLEDADGSLSDIGAMGGPGGGW